MPLLILVALNVGACTAGSGEGLDISGRPLSEGGNVPLAPTLASIQANVFNPSCIVCHSGAGAPLGLRLDATNSFANLVGVPSRQSSGTLRVNPGAPDRSYLVHKLEGTAASGEQMPFGGPPVPQATIDFVRQWITDGALPVAINPVTAPVILAVTPDPDSTVAALPLQITVAFDQDIDASTINAMTFDLRRSGGDDIFDNGNDQTINPLSVGLSTLNPRLATFDLSGVTPVEDRYRITLRGSGASFVLSVGGQRLDGEFAGALPSGDGMEGGDFAVELTLRGIQPTLQSIQDNVFAVTCSPGCHTGPDGPILPAGMDLSSAAASFASLVGEPSIEQPLIQRVARNDAAGSYLVRKIEGTAATGDRMPLGGPPLNQVTIAAIRDWIDQGANP